MEEELGVVGEELRTDEEEIRAVGEGLRTVEEGLGGPAVGET